MANPAEDERILTSLERRVKRDYTEDVDAHDDAIVDYDSYEAMHMARTYDSVSRQMKSGLTDSATATIYLERAARVAGQLPEGEVIALGKSDQGKGMLMDILRQKWIYPNANAQRPFRTKTFLWQYGSSEYGWMPMYYDLHVKPDGKVVPDCWLWNPRNFIPQNGFTTVPDMDYCHAIAYKSYSYFKGLLDEDEDSGWKKDVIEEMLDIFRNADRQTDPQRDTLQVRDKQHQSMRQVAVATRYEAGKKGRWITFLPDYGYRVLRNIKNPHKNARIPFVIKPCIPSYDSFYNVGDFQRSKPMQFANDGLDNLYFEGIKINLIPAIIANANGVKMSTLKPGVPGNVMLETQPNSIRRMDTSTAGLNTYQAAKGMVQGAIQSIAGTTDTRANAESSMNPGFGRTPEALKMIGERESTRDNQDRELLEEAEAELLDGMLSLIPNMMTEDVPVWMFAKEIEEIVDAGYKDVLEMIKDKKMSGVSMEVSNSGQAAKFIIDPKALKGLEYRFQLEPNSTAKKTKEAQLNALKDYFQTMGMQKDLLLQLQERGMTFDLVALNKIYATLSDVPGIDEIVRPLNDEEKQAIEQAKASQQPQGPPQQGQGGGIDPAQLAQAAAMNPEDIAMGGMNPEMSPTDQLPAPQPPEPMVVGGLQFNDPELANRAAELEQLRSVA